MANDVTFRKVRGRVVPMHLEQDTKDGMSLTAAGIGTAVGAGGLAAYADRQAAYAANAGKTVKRAAHKLYQFNQRKEGRQLIHKAARHMLEAKRFSAAGNAIKISGFATGSGMIAAGVDKALPQKFKDKHPAGRIAITANAGLASALLIRSAYYKGIRASRIKGQGMKVIDAVKLAAKRVMARGPKV